MRLIRGRGALAARRACGALALMALAGCEAGVLDPHGPIGRAERTMLLDATVIMLAIVVPVIVLTLVFAWWFRASNHRARRRPDWSYSGSVEVVIWCIPALVIFFLGGMAWVSSHDLDPTKPIESRMPALDVEVVALDWKWLFIYPQEGVATINRLVVPVGRPLRIRLTSAGVMNSFFVPQLGSQIYAMGGMETHLNLLADTVGTYEGLSAQFSGAGFSDMRFELEATSPGLYDGWLAAARRTGGVRLDAAELASLVKPSQSEPARLFASVEPGIFDRVLQTAQGRPDARMTLAALCAPRKD